MRNVKNFAFRTFKLKPFIYDFKTIFFFTIYIFPYIVYEYQNCAVCIKYVKGIYLHKGSIGIEEKSPSEIFSEFHVSDYVDSEK